MGNYGASCFHTFSKKERDIEKEQWDVERFGQVCTQAATLAEWKAAILKLCSKTGRCDFQTVQEVKNFGKKIDRVRRRAATIAVSEPSK